MLLALSNLTQAQLYTFLLLLIVAIAFIGFICSYADICYLWRNRRAIKKMKFHISFSNRYLFDIVLIILFGLTTVLTLATLIFGLIIEQNFMLASLATGLFFIVGCGFGMSTDTIEFGNALAIYLHPKLYKKLNEAGAKKS